MRVLLSCICSVLVIAVAAQDLRKYQFEEVHMGTLFQMTIYHSSDSMAHLASQQAFSRIAELDSICSDYRLDSELNHISASAYDMPIQLSNDLRFLLVTSKKINEQSDGLFSIASGPLTKLWRRAIRRQELPEATTIDRLLSHCQTDDIVIHKQTNTIQLLKENMRLDLGGIAKGYAVDEAFQVLRGFGIETAIVDGGGDIFVGKSPTQSKWRIAVGDELLELDDFKAVATSGSVFRHVTIDETSYSHIIDPRNGWGIVNPREVTVIADKCYIADALATIMSIDNHKDLSHVYTYNLMIHQKENIR